MNEIQTFTKDEFGSIRTVEINNDPWFVGKDVAECLGYSNPRKAIIDHVDLEDKCDGVTIRDSIGREQTPMLISESGLYSLIMSSQLPKAREFKRWVTSDVLPSIRKHGAYATDQVIDKVLESGLYSLIMSSQLPKAREFKRWVTSDVLPSIRKHGAYATDQVIDKVLNDPDFGIKLLTELKEERQKREALEIDNKRMKPKEIFSDAVASSSTSILIGDLAKLLRQNGICMGQKRLFSWLRDKGYLIKRKGSDWNSPTQRAMEMGLFDIKETAITKPDGHTIVSKTTKVTGYLIKRKGSDWNSPTQRAMEMGLFDIKETAITKPDGHTIVSKTTKVTGKGQVYFVNLFLGEGAKA